MHCLKTFSSVSLYSNLFFFHSQVLADRIAVGCTLNRGEYNLAWNEVMLPDCDDTVCPYFVNLLLSFYSFVSSPV